MGIIAKCNHCDTRVELGVDGGAWSPARTAETVLALEGTNHGALVYAYLPNGWSTARINGGLDLVLRCPEHVFGDREQRQRSGKEKQSGAATRARQ
jgi:hypothetical protein